jgi:hypothetical protein
VASFNCTSRNLEQSPIDAKRLSASQKFESLRSSSQYCLLQDIDRSMKRAAGVFSPRIDKEERRSRPSQSHTLTSSASLPEILSGMTLAELDAFDRSSVFQYQRSRLAMLEDLDKAEKTIFGHSPRSSVRAPEIPVSSIETRKHSQFKRRNSVASASTSCCSTQVTGDAISSSSSSEVSAASYILTHEAHPRNDPRSEPAPWSPPSGKAASPYFSESQSLAASIDAPVGCGSPRPVHRQTSQGTVPRISAADMKAYLAQTTPLKSPKPSPRNAVCSRPKISEIMQTSGRPSQRRASKSSASLNACTTASSRK